MHLQWIFTSPVPSMTLTSNSYAGPESATPFGTVCVQGNLNAGGVFECDCTCTLTATPNTAS